MRLTKVGLAVLTALVASGCNDDNSTSTDIAPAKLNFSIQGIATDAPVSNALITATIGEHVITTTADAAGYYSLDFEYDEGSITGAEMVKVTAKGEGQQSHVELISQLGTFGKLLDQAGDDATLEQEESSRTSITQISTAMHFLSQQSGQAISDDASLLEAESSIDTEQLLEISAVIKVLADNPAYTPDEEESILDILSSSEKGVAVALEEYFATKGLVDESGELLPELSEAVDQAKQQTIDDPLVTTGFDSADIKGTYLLHSSVTSGWVAANGNVIRIEDADQARFGYFQGYDFSADTDSAWTVTDTGKLHISNLNDLEFYLPMSGDQIAELFGEEVQETLPDDIYSYNVKQTLNEITLTKLTDEEASKVATKFTYQYTLDIPDSELLTTTSDVISTAVISKTDSDNDIWQDAPSGTWALPIISSLQHYSGQVNDYLVHQQVTLDESTAVLDPEGNSLGSWSFTNGELSIQGTQGWEVSYRPHKTENGLTNALVTITVDGQEQTTLRWIAPFAQEESTLKEDLFQELPNLLSAWINSWMASEGNAELPDATSIYGYTFTESGEVYWTFSQYDEDNNIYFEPNYDNFQQWSSPKDHQYILKGKYDLGSGYLQERERTWTTISTLESGQHLVLEHSQMRYGYSDEPLYDGYFILPRINVLKPIDLSVYEDAYQRSIDNGSIIE